MTIIESHKIAMLLPDLRGGGTERVAVNLANAFVDRAIATDMIVMSPAGVYSHLLRPDVRMVSLDVPRMRSIVMPLVRYLRAERPTALLANMWPLTVIAILARRIAGVSTRLVVAEHIAWPEDDINGMGRFERWTFRTSLRLLFPRADGVVAVSHGVADDLARLTGIDRKRIAAIYNPIVAAGVVVSKAPERMPENWWYGSHKRVVAVGSLCHRKDYPTLLRAMAQLRQQVDARLLILGEGECKAELGLLATELGIADFVDLFGFANDPSPYYRHADLHVLCSKREGFGNVIVEALEAGTPVVSTDCLSGPREILGEGRFGRLVPVGDAEALATAMAETLADFRDRAALQARARDFSIDMIADQYLALLLPDGSYRGAE